MGGCEALVDAVWRCAIPTSPAPRDVRREAFGLTTLALALRLEHIGRVSESLNLVDSTNMARTVRVDVDLAALTAEQRDAVRSDDGRTLRVPIARLPRRDLAPVEVRDAAGRVRPLPTRTDVERSMADGLHRAFRMLLDAHPLAETLGSPLHRVRTDLHRSRWLIRAAIARLIAEGPVAGVDGRAARAAAHARPIGGSDRVTRSAQIRAAAEEAVRVVLDEASPFPVLLDVAAGEHVLLAEVEAAGSEVFLSYEAPLMAALGARGGGQSARRIVRGALDEFTVEYRTVIPRAVDSYDVTVEVPREITVRRLFLSSDVDTPALEALTTSMESVATAYSTLETVSPKLLELELQSIASRLAELGRRRAADLATAAAPLALTPLTGPHGASSTTEHADRAFAPNAAGAGAADRANSASTARPDAASVLGGPAAVTALAEFARRYEDDDFRKLADGTLSPPVLRRLAARLRAEQVDRDVVVDNDPREHAGHVHWRRRPFGSSADVEEDGAAEPVAVAVHVTLVDDPPSLASNVWKLLVGILALVGGAGVLLFPSRLPFGAGDGAASVVLPAGGLDNPDALVTVLLLVPGLLLSRLAIPPRASVLGTLRRIPQYVAYLAVFVAAGLALVVAVAPGAVLSRALAVGVLVIVVLLVVALGNEAVKARRRRIRVPKVTTTPRWLLAEAARPLRRDAKEPTVRFSSVETGAEGSR